MISGSRSAPSCAVHVVAAVIAALVGWLGSLAAYAADKAPAQKWGIEQLMQGLAEVKTAKGKFIERKYLAILTEPLQFSGTLVYTAPGHLEKYTVSPKPESLVLDQDKVTIESKATNQRRVLALQEYPPMWAFVESFRSTLAGDLATLKRFYRVRLEGNETQWQLELKPTEPNMQAIVTEIRIGGSRNRISSIEVTESQGNRSVMTITGDVQ
jgi:outer membrane lipoprotein-sorting protein